MKLNKISFQIILALAILTSAVENAIGQAPGNDLCANAISIAIPSTTSGNTTLATAETVPNCGSAFGIAAGNGVWYSVVGNGQKLTASVCGNASFDTQIAVFTGTCGSLVCVDGNDNFCSSQSEVSWCTTNATPYLVLVYGAFSIDKGSFVLNLSTQNVAQPTAFTTTIAAICRPQSNVVYTIPNDPTVTYNWSYSGTGATITGSTNSVTVSYSASATSGNLSVTPTNGCTSGVARTLAIVVSSAVPSMPGAFTTSSPSVCQGQYVLSYIIPNDPTVTYNWSYSGTGATINGTTASILVSFSATATGGNLSVTATNACGTGPARVLAITVNAPPALPGTITGNTAICPGTTNAYSIAAVSGAISYTWAFPSGWTASPASTTNSINLISSASGNVSVYANSAACSSPVQSLSVNSGVPLTPGSITGNASTCSGLSATYSVVTVNGATSYTWSQPTGWTGTSTTNSITYSSAGVAGNISVTANNSCGSSTSAASKAITITSVPAQPTLISGLAAACVGVAYTYGAPSVSGATSYTWTVPVGWTVTPSTTNSMSVTPSATAVNGDITVVANNACGPSLSKSLAVTVGVVAAQPGAFTAAPALVCTGTSGTAVTYTVPSVTGVTYTWSYSGTGAALGSSGNSNSVVFNFNSGSTSGSISVTGSSTCGVSIARTVAVTVGTTVQPGAFTTSTNSVCPGQSNVSYVVPNDPGLTYAWTYSGEATTIAASANTAVLSFGAAATGGTLSVTATNTCGIGAPRTSTITVTPNPAKPSIIVDTSNPEAPKLSSSTQTATSYSWFKDGSKTAFSPSASVTIAGAGSYTLKVFVNGCESPLSDPVGIIVTGDILNDNQITSIHPVPAHEQLFVKGTALHSGNWGIINTQGRETRPPIQLMEDGSIINIGELTSGIYFLRANDGKKMVSIKFIKD